MNNELIAFLKNESVRTVAKRMPALKSQNINADYASDFDVFNALGDSIYLLVGNPIRDKLLDLISKSLGLDVSANMLYDSHYRIALWQKIFIDGDIDLPNPKRNLDLKGINNGKKSSSSLVINNVLDPSYDSIFDLLDSFLVKIKSEGIDTLCLDARNISFVRPDDFHTQQNYESLKSGKEDSSMLILWLTCRVLMNTNIRLSIVIDKSDIAEKILELVFRFAPLLNITLRIAPASLDDANKIYDALLRYNKKNISLELACAKENIDVLINFLRTVPLVFVKEIDTDAGTLREVFYSLLSMDESELAINYLYKAK